VPAGRLNRARQLGVALGGAARRPWPTLIEPTSPRGGKIKWRATVPHVRARWRRRPWRSLHTLRKSQCTKRIRYCGQTNGPKVARSAGGDRDDLVTHLRYAAVALFATAVSYAVSAWAVSSARAFTMENLSTGGNTTRFAEPDGPANNFGRGAQAFGPRGPIVQFGARQGQLTPFSRSPGSGYNSTPPEPYARPLSNGD
jgi:hypothetical protein